MLTCVRCLQGATCVAGAGRVAPGAGSGVEAVLLPVLEQQLLASHCIGICSLRIESCRCGILQDSGLGSEAVALGRE